MTKRMVFCLCLSVCLQLPDNILADTAAQQTLFPTDLPSKEWMQFRAEGFDTPVCGLIFQSDSPAEPGMPLGGIGTGWIDLNNNGKFGDYTIFNSLFPRRKVDLPFLGFSVGDKVWLLTTDKIAGVNSAANIRYWGHYPVADIEYELSAPVHAGLRAWSPFMPGHAEISNTPAAIFEVHLRNPGDKAQSGRLAFSVPGFSERYPGEKWRCQRADVKGAFNGWVVSKGRERTYAIGTITPDTPSQVGAELAANSEAWAGIAGGLPAFSGSYPSGSSVVVDFNLQPGESKTIRFLLAWYVPWYWDYNLYQHAYGRRFQSALEIAQMVAHNHESLLERVLAWQEVIYNSSHLPVWMRDTLVNNFHLLVKDGHWFHPSQKVPWSGKNGIFSITESPDCPQQECVPSNWYASHSLVYFFPELHKTTYEVFRHFQREDGAIAFVLGGGGQAPDGGEGATPGAIDEPDAWIAQCILNGSIYVQQIDRLWQRTGDDGILSEFYPSIKRALDWEATFDILTYDLKGPVETEADGLLDCGGRNSEQFYDEWYWYGPSIQVNGLWLATLRIGERMAAAMGDAAYAEKCRLLAERVSKAIEKKLWNGSYYLAYNDARTKRKSDKILGNQLTGQFIAKCHGLPGVFPPERVSTTLRTVADVLLPMSDYGLLSVIRPDGVINMEDEGVWQGSNMPYRIFYGETFCLASTYLYEGDPKNGLDLTYKAVHGLSVAKNRPWDPPSVSHYTGDWLGAHDYSQYMSFWHIPAALEGKDIRNFCAPGGLVDRIIQAGKE